MSGTTPDWIQEPLDQYEAALAAGGIELNGAGFHQYPGNGFTQLGTFPVVLVNSSYSGASGPEPHVASVVISRDDVLTLGVRDAVSVVNGADPSLRDVQVRFNRNVAPYAQGEYKGRQTKLEQGLRPDHQGVAFLYRGRVYSSFTYDIVEAAAENGTYLTVAELLPVQEATSMVGAILGN
ncbi:MAG TPA: hypothetical protein ENK43_04195 [Planctomycetes bacterium]|nr:hypothetical protein [Planctomycetota bacterium]